MNAESAVQINVNDTESEDFLEPENTTLPTLHQQHTHQELKKPTLLCAQKPLKTKFSTSRQVTKTPESDKFGRTYFI